MLFVWKNFDAIDIVFILSFLYESDRIMDAPSLCSFLGAVLALDLHLSLFPFKSSCCVIALHLQFLSECN